MFCHDDCITAVIYSPAKLFMALTNKERWNITDLYREKLWRSAHCGNIRRWLQQEKSCWWDTWMHKSSTLQPWNRTDALLLKKRKNLNWLNCGVEVSWEQVESRRKKLMFYMHESIWNWRIYLSSETSQTGCLTATLPSHKTQHFAWCRVFVFSLSNVFPIAKYCIYREQSVGDPDTPNSLSGMSECVAMLSVFHFYRK